MCVRCLGFVLLLWFPGVLHAQRAEQPCPAPLLNEGYLVPKQEMYLHETTLSYACNKGYKPAAGGWWATSMCENGQWSHQPQCINEKACISPIVPNAEITGSSNSWYEQGHTLTITCKEGYEPEDPTVSCVDGAWSSAPVCDRSIDACGEPPHIPHAVIIGQGYQEVLAAGSRVQYECENGYTTEGTNTQKSIVCSSGNWSEGPTCRSTSSGSHGGGNDQYFAPIANCGRFPVVPNGVVAQADRLYLKYQCGDYYKQVGPDTVVCYRGGNWSEVPTCEAAFCSVDTNAYSLLKSVGFKYIKEGESEKLECEDLWWTDHFSLAQCTDRKITFSRCCSWLHLGRC